MTSKVVQNVCNSPWQSLSPSFPPSLPPPSLSLPPIPSLPHFLFFFLSIYLSLPDKLTQTHTFPPQQKSISRLSNDLFASLFLSVFSHFPPEMTRLRCPVHWTIWAGHCLTWVVTRKPLHCEHFAQTVQTMLRWTEKNRSSGEILEGESTLFDHVMSCNISTSVGTSTRRELVTRQYHTSHQCPTEVNIA